MAAIPQDRLRRLHVVRGMNRRVCKCWRKHGGYTRYFVNARDMPSPYINSKFYFYLLKNNNLIKLF